MGTLRTLAALLCTACLAVTATAQDAYPSKPVRIIVPFPPGGGSDLVARTVSARLTERWKQPVTVENKPGGNTIIAAEAEAAADGYTLFVAIDSTLAMNQSLYSKLPYDPVKSFTPVTLAVTMPMVLAVPYKGGAPAMTDTVGGQVPIIFDAQGPAMPFIKGGKMRPLAVTSAARNPLLPESGVGMTVVANTPEQFAQTIRDDTQKFGRIIKAAGIKLD